MSPVPGRHNSSSNSSLGSASSKRSKEPYNPSLSSIDSQVPMVPSPNHPIAGGGVHNWDTEAEHILSFFLGGDGPQATNSSVTAYTSTTDGHISASATANPAADGESKTGEDVKMEETAATAGTGAAALTDVMKTSTSSSASDEGKEEEDEDDDDDDVIPPPTPALHFYAATPSHKSRRSGGAAGSTTNPNLRYNTFLSSQPMATTTSQAAVQAAAAAPPVSTLSSMAASLAGGPLVYGGGQVYHSSQQQQQQLANSVSYQMGALHLHPAPPSAPANAPATNSTVAVPTAATASAASATSSTPASTVQPQQPASAAAIPTVPSAGSVTAMNVSPVSPAALIGTGHENLMLPPYQTGNTSQHQQPAPLTRPPQPAHLAPPRHPPAAQQQQASTRNAAVPASSPVPSGHALAPHLVATMAVQPQQPLHSQPQLHPPAAPPRPNPESHLAWLRSINALAAQHNPNGVVLLAPAPTPPAYYQQPVAPASAVYTSTPAATGVVLPSRPPGPPSAALQLLAQMPPNAAALAAATNALKASASPPPAPESAEKRAKRLERNRESARRSRRKKKERLETLEAQVNQLYGEIEEERKKQIEVMVPQLRQGRQAVVQNANASVQSAIDSNTVNQTGTIIDRESALRQYLYASVADTGCNSETSRAVVEYQHNTLKQLVLPRYQRLLLWMALQEEEYFTAGKEEHARWTAANQAVGNVGKQAKSAVSVKISSKMIGEEMSTRMKNSKDDQNKKETSFKDWAERGAASNILENNKLDRSQIVVANANDATRAWPLFCYDMSFSVDQEERFLAARKRVRDQMEHQAAGKSLHAYCKAQIGTAVQTADIMQEAVGSLSRVVAEREQGGLLGILSPHQVIAYQAWLTSNRARVAELVSSDAQVAATADQAMAASTVPPDVCMRDGGIHNRAVPQVAPSATTGAINSAAAISESSLLHICQRLNEVLKISSPAINESVSQK